MQYEPTLIDFGLRQERLGVSSAPIVRICCGGFTSAAIDGPRRAALGVRRALDRRREPSRAEPCVHLPSAQGFAYHLLPRLRRD
jgi:hypothetical protein